MDSSILNSILYNQRIKKLANKFLEVQILFKNPLFKKFQENKIKKVINEFKEKPFSLRIENTNVCNSRCFMCPHSTMKRKQGFMSREVYKKIIDDAADIGVDFITIHNFGEPLLDKDFIWKVVYAKKKGIARVTTNTNAAVMDSQYAEKIIKSGLDEIFFSLDAVTENTYNKIRIGLNFKKVIKNVENLIKLKNESGQTRPKIIVDFLESDLNKQEVGLFIKKWNNLADSVCISKIHDWTAKKRGLVRDKYKNFVSFSQTPCRLPFTELSVNWDGGVSICCQDIEGKYLIGDLTKHTITDIWKSEKLKTIRSKMSELDVEKLPLCINCKLRTFWWAF